MSNLYLSLDSAVEKIARLSHDIGGLYIDTSDDFEWLKNELEQVCEIQTCELCKNANYTAEPFPVQTKTGKTVDAVFNFCPVCGRDLRPTETNAWGEE